MKSTMGRPRALTDEQIKRVLTWHAEKKALRAALKRLGTRRELAAELGVAVSTVGLAIACEGRFKQAETQERALVAAERIRQVKKLRKNGFL